METVLMNRTESSSSERPSMSIVRNTLATHAPSSNTETLEEAEKRLIESRGALKWLPTHEYSNDMEFGMWWMVLGSFLSAIFPVFPLIALANNESLSSTGLVQDAEIVTYSMTVFAGIAFTIGSYAVKRAVQQPPMQVLSSLDGYISIS